MSNKIDSTTGVNISAPPSGSGKAAKTRSSDSSSSTVGSVGSSDTLHLTGDAQQFQDLSAALSSAPVVNVSRVADIRQSIASGQYNIDDKAVAAKLMMFDRNLGE